MHKTNKLGLLFITFSIILFTWGKSPTLEAQWKPVPTPRPRPTAIPVEPTPPPTPIPQPTAQPTAVIPTPVPTMPVGPTPSVNPKIVPCGPVLRLFLFPSLSIKRNENGVLIWPDGTTVTMEIDKVTYTLKAQ